MKGNKVLDSWALIAYFENETGADEVKRLFLEAAGKEEDLLISIINWGEVLYVIERRYGKARRDEAEHLMTQMHLEVVDLDKELVREAAHLKATEKLSYADAFAASLAKLRKAALVTGDKDFKPLESEIKIEWL